MAPPDVHDTDTVTPEQAVEAERERVHHLTRLAELHSVPRPQLDRWIGEGVSFRAAADHILQVARAQPRRATTPVADAGDAIGLSQRDRDRYSIRAAVMQGLGERHPGEGEPAGLETEVSRALEEQLPKDYKRHGGILIPSGLAYPHARRGVDHAVLERMTPGYATRQTGLDTQTQFAGQELVFEEFGGFAELLRNRTLVLQFGARYLPGLVGDASIVRQTAAAVAEWTGESPGGDVSDTELALDLVTLRPKTLMGSTFFTRQLLRQSAATVPVDMLVEDDLLAVHQRALDLAALHGAGTATEPQGIYGATGVNSVAINGNPTYAQLVSMITPIAEANGDVSRLAYMTTARVATKLMVTEIFPGTPSGSPVWTGTVADGRVAGYRAGATNQVSSTLAADGVGPTPTPLSHHGLILGDWPGMTIGEWGMVELIADPYTRKKRGIIEVTSFQMVDIQLVRPELFAVGTGVLIS